MLISFINSKATMTLQEAWLELIVMENYENLSPTQIYSILSDYGIFKENPKLRLITKSALEYGLWQLFKSGAKRNEIDLLKTKLINDGFDEKVVTEILKCFLPLDPNEHKSNCSYNVNYKQFDSGNKCSHLYDNHIKFWGNSLGHKIDLIDQYLKEKGYGLSKYNDSKDIKKLYNAYGRTELFLGYGSGIYVYESPYSKLVYKIEVYLSKVITKKVLIYNELYPLLIQKYGKPFKDDNIQTYGPHEGNGIFFEVPEGKISMFFGRYFEGQHSLYLTYEDKITSDKVLSEIIKYEEELRIKWALIERKYQEKLSKDL